jgi:endonuclease-8
MTEMPEGDTIFRTATTLRKWVQGHKVTRVQTKVRGLQLDRVVGTTIDEVEPKAKHLLIRFSNGLVLHTHMRMTGSWHLYRAGERWKKPQWQAKIVIECGERLVVCFNAPVVELLLPSEERRHRSLNGLGPDVLGQGEFDHEEVRRRAAVRDPQYTLGELLLDQQVVSGIGNIYRCESLFIDRWNPWTPQSVLDPAQLDHLVTTAMNLMKANIGPAGSRGRDFGAGGPNAPWVYGRTNRPCRVCGSPISGSRMGKQARDVFWCPKCQASVAP